MIRVTEELWNEKCQEVRKLVCNEYEFDREKDYYSEVMKKITGKEIRILDLTAPNTTFSGVKEYEAYVTKTLPEKHKLDPGIFTVLTSYPTNANIYGIDHTDTLRLSSPNITTEIHPLAFFGDDLCITFSKIHLRDEAGENKGVILASMIFYTSESAEKVKEISTDLCEFAKTLPPIAPPPEDTIPVNFVYRTNSGLSLYKKDVKVSNITLSEFNQDLPDDKIQKELRKDGAGLLIFHGEPGCGKSSYIKYLIGTMKDKKFVVVSQDSLIGNMDDFRTLLLTECKDDSIIIIEDCENLVKSREQVGSSIVISDFLNMTDGIYGDLLRIKFILTFNTEIQKIDSALLRKGRLKCKYKFSKLKGEKLKKLAKELGLDIKESQLSVGLTLADLYNFNYDTGNVETVRTPIGF